MMKIIYLFLIMLDSLSSFQMTSSLTSNYLNGLYTKRELYNTRKYDKNPSINYLSYLNYVKPIPIYSKTNLIKKTTYDDIFLNICDNNIYEFVIDDDVTKLIVKYYNGMYKIYYNNDNGINKLINVYLMNLDNHINFSTLNETDDKYFYEK